MTVTFELSYYPLRDNYPEAVLALLDDLRKLEGISMETNGMSTILIGEFDRIWSVLGDLANYRLEIEDAVIVLKVAPGRREYLE